MPGPRPYIGIDFLMLPGAERLGIFVGILPLARHLQIVIVAMQGGSISEMSHTVVTLVWRELAYFLVKWKPDIVNNSILL